MENGSTPPSADAGEADQNGHLPLSARLLGVGVRGVRTVGKATGVDRAVEVAAEEAIVAAVESEAVERAMARVLQGPIVEEAVQGALESEAVKKALLEAMDSDLVDEVWRRLLASEEAQQLVERIAEAPEVRAAISAQGAGLLEDIGRTIGKLTRRLDDSFERVVRRVFFRRRRAVASDHAGAVSRALAFVIDGVFVNLGFTAIVAIVTLVDNAFGGSGGGASNFAIAIGSTAWLALGSLYLVGFWSLAGQTPGMRFVGIRLNVRAAAVAALAQAPHRPRPLRRHLRHRLPRHRLPRAAPRLGRPLQRHRRDLRRAPPGAGPVVAARPRRERRRAASASAGRAGSRCRRGSAGRR